MWFRFRKKKPDDGTLNYDHHNEELRSEGRAPLSEIARKVKQIEMSTLRKMQSKMLGDYKSRFKGQGMQFADFRVYNFGDDVRHIDWRASAKSQQTLIKTFEEERELNIVCAVDISASNLFGSTEQSKSESITLAVASIAFSAIKNNDRIGLLLFSDKIEKYVPPKKGRKHALRIIDELVSFKPAQQGTNLNGAMEYLGNMLNHSTVLFVASDFFDDVDKNKIRQLTKRHDVIAIHVSDERDLEIPDIGLVQFLDPETGETKVIDTGSRKNRESMRLSQQNRKQGMLEFLKSNGVSVIDIDTKASAPEEISKFFHARRQVK